MNRVSIDVSAGQKEWVEVSAVSALLSEDKYVFVVLVDGRKCFLSRCTGLTSLKKCEESGLFSDFLRIHKSYLVNPAHISQIRRHDYDAGLDIMVGAKCYGVSRTRQSAVRQWWRDQAGEVAA